MADTTRLPSAVVALLFALASAGLTSACSLLPGDDDAATGGPSADAAAALPPTTVRPSTTTTVETASPRAGGPDAGDPLFPGLGNSGYDVQHYDIAIDVSGDEFRAEANVELIPDAPLTSFNLDLVSTVVDRVFIDGVQAPFERQGRELVITPSSTLAQGEVATVKVEYRGTPEPIADPAGPIALGWHTHEWGTYVASEPVGAATWFPANDHPTDKATFVFRITVPEGHVAAGPGVLVSETTTATRTTFVWASNDPMATYSASIVTGDFAIITNSEADGPVIRNVLPTERASQLLPALASTGEMLAVFEEIFGPYPFESYGAVVAPVPLPGALETQTLPVYGPRSFREDVIAHELAHQWFGNNVAVSDWRDIWLSEGFAVYAGALWTEHSQGVEAFETELRSRYQMLDRYDIPGPADPGVENLFGGAVYVRGGWVLHGLRLSVGDEAFFRSLRAYHRRFGGGNATTADFQDVLEECSGRELDAVFDAWLRSESLPAVPAMELAPTDGE